MTSAGLNVPFPSTIDEKTLNPSTGHIENHDRKNMFLSFFVYSIELFEILNNALKNIYHNTPTDRQPEPNAPNWWSREQLGHITLLNHALDDLSSKLPAHLHPNCSTQRNYLTMEDSLQWQGYVLRGRY